LINPNEERATLLQPSSLKNEWKEARCGMDKKAKANEGKGRGE